MNVILICEHLNIPYKFTIIVMFILLYSSYSMATNTSTKTDSNFSSSTAKSVFYSSTTSSSFVDNISSQLRITDFSESTTDSHISSPEAFLPSISLSTGECVNKTEEDYNAPQWQCECFHEVTRIVSNNFLILIFIYNSMSVEN